MTWSELLETDLAASPVMAADYLRDAFADEDPRTFVAALRHVIAARGSIEDLHLSGEETTAMLNRLAGHFKTEVALPQAA